MRTCSHFRYLNLATQVARNMALAGAVLPRDGPLRGRITSVLGHIIARCATLPSQGRTVMPAQGSVRVVRFGDYDLDLESNELRKHGHKVPVPDQAFQILAMLLERPGEIVSREQLIARLWPNGTTVEFDHGINSSVRRLRAALNDSAD